MKLLILALTFGATMTMGEVVRFEGGVEVKCTDTNKTLVVDVVQGRQPPVIVSCK